MSKHLFCTAFALIAACNSTPSGDGSDQDGGAGLEPIGPVFPCAGDSSADDPLTDGNLRCFNDIQVPEAPPILAIEYAAEQYDGVEAIHVRLTFSPTFVDNSYGSNAMGWDRGHKFKDLLGSDHARVILLDAAGETIFDLDLDYISEDPDSPCGYGSLGPMGGSGSVNTGDTDAILGWSTSLDDNLNLRGYCQFTEDSPRSDPSCSVISDAPGWDFRVVYDVWMRADAFAPAGFGTAHMDSVHASPSKGEDNTVEVTPGDCPQDWCRDPAACAPPGDECTDETHCATNEFCGEGHCVPIVL
jgi:hypothetical protein